MNEQRDESWRSHLILNKFFFYHYFASWKKVKKLDAHVIVCFRFNARTKETKSERKRKRQSEIDKNGIRNTQIQIVLIRWKLYKWSAHFQPKLRKRRRNAHFYHEPCDFLRTRAISSDKWSFSFFVPEAKHPKTTWKSFSFAWLSFGFFVLDRARLSFLSTELALLGGVATSVSFRHHRKEEENISY